MSVEGFRTSVSSSRGGGENLMRLPPQPRSQCSGWRCRVRTTQTGPAPASASRWSSAPGQVTSRCGPHLEGRVTMPTQDGSRVVSGSLDPRILPASLQALPCCSAHGADPPPHDVRRPCLPSRPRTVARHELRCLSLPPSHYLGASSVPGPVRDNVGDVRGPPSWGS